MLTQTLQTKSHPRNIHRIMLLKSQQRQCILKQNKSILQLLWIIRPFKNCTQIKTASDEFTKILVRNGYFLSRGKMPGELQKTKDHTS